MGICEKCKERIASDEPDLDTPFPAYSVAGGIAGTAAAAVTGVLLVIPAAVLAGAVADALGRRCSLCGFETPDDEPTYHLMEALDGAPSGGVYRPVSNSAGTLGASPQLNADPARRPPSKNPHSPPTEQMPFPDLPCPIEDERQSPTDFVFDEVEGKLVPREQPLGGLPDVSVDSDISHDESPESAFDKPERSVLPENLPTLDHMGRGDIEGLDEPWEPPMEDLLL